MSTVHALELAVLKAKDKYRHESKKHSDRHKSRSPSQTAPKHNISSLSHARSGYMSHTDPAGPVPNITHMEGKTWHMGSNGIDGDLST